MGADRELRLRRRIDELTDQRDSARQERDNARAWILEARRQRARLRARIRTLERRLDLWRQRERQP